MQAGDLRCKVDFYKPTSTLNELGEDIHDTLALVAEKVPAQITPTSGRNMEMMGDLDNTLVTHKIRIRTGAVDMTPDLVIKFNDQRYDVKYWQPVYKNQRYMEIMTAMEISV